MGVIKRKGTRKIRKNRRTHRKNNRSYKRMKGGLTLTSKVRKDLTPNPDNRNLAFRLTDNLKHLCFQDETEPQKNNLAIAKQIVTNAVSRATNDKKQFLNESFAALFGIDIANLRNLIIPSSTITLNTDQHKALIELCNLYDLIYRLNTQCLSESKRNMLNGTNFRKELEYILTGQIFSRTNLLTSSGDLDEVNSSLRELNLILFPQFFNQIIMCLLKPHSRTTSVP